MFIRAPQTFKERNNLRDLKDPPLRCPHLRTEMWGTEGVPSVLDMDGVSSIGRWDAAWGLDPRALTEPRRLTSLLNKLGSTTARPYPRETANEKEEVTPLACEGHKINHM